MIIRQTFQFIKDPVWQKLTSFSLVLFFILLADALLSYWVPNFLQDSLKSSFLMGVVMSFSSVVGFGADLVFPQILKGTTVRRLLFSAIMTSVAFVVALGIGVKFPILIILLVAMTIWGIYYEYLGFSTQQFMADSLPFKLRSSGWAMVDVFKNLAYLLGPILAAFLLAKGEYQLLSCAIFFIMIGLLIHLISGKHHERALSVEPSEINIWRELSHWKVLFVHVWPVVFISLFMGLIDATFWTTGVVWMEEISDSSFAGALLLPAYQLPSLFMGYLIAKRGVFEHKKKTAEKYLLLSGLFLALLYFDLPIALYVLIVFVSSIFLAYTFPLTEAVYTDLTARMGVERKHLVGLSSSTMSLAYIISPAIAGFVAEQVGEKMTFVVIGLATIAVSSILLLVTPKKLHLPQSEIKRWQD